MRFVLWGWACAPSEPATGPRSTHMTEWDALVSAAERGDVATAKVLARDLSMGEVAEDHPGAAQVGAALGFLQQADDALDLADGVDRARAGCVACHVAHGVPGPT
ncbi:MAG: hypothetical protein ABMA64_32820 [Myxococcota bacterium]